MQQPDADNLIFKTAAAFITNSNHPVFLTGKAGTGKTTFLKYIKENCRKNTIVVAPTGVAAINAGGTTIHSFFQLPFSPFLPAGKNQFGIPSADKNNLLANLRLNAERRGIIEELELLIIDEISMVRCDVLDAIDVVLRHVRHKHAKPFGGVQVLYIGDMYQLPPVVKDEEWRILGTVYDNPYFFSSQVVAEQHPVYIELKKVYRQSDLSFINLLNQVRNNEMDEDGYELLHSRYMPGFIPSPDSKFITLTTHNNKADAINSRELNKLEDRTTSYNATVNGSFSENSFPADEVLNLKTGAQVMFLKNDIEKIRRYYNGKIGVIQKMEDDKIWVECKQGDASQLVEVKRETWRSIKYAINSKTQLVEEEELGSFVQYPLRLAWAITIHKSQGLTFENAIIDAGNAFAPGQVYVALSRCTTLEGIVLHSKISQNSLHSDERIVAFATKQQGARAQELLLFNATKQFQQEIITELFDYTHASVLVKGLLNWCKDNKAFGQVVYDWLQVANNQLEILKKLGAKFTSEIDGYFLQDCLPAENEVFQERFRKAIAWYIPVVSDITSYLQGSPAVTDNIQFAKEYNGKLQEIFHLISYTLHLLQACKNGFDLDCFIKAKTTFQRRDFPVNAYAGRSGFTSRDVQYPDLFNELRDKRNEIALEKDVPLFMVCKTQALEEMSRYLPGTLTELGKISGFGAVKLKQYGTLFIDIIRNYCERNSLETGSLEIEKKIKRTRSVSTSTQSKVDTKQASYDLYKAGKTVEAIAIERNLSASTIETHLAHFIGTGSLDINALVDAHKQQLIVEAINASSTNNSLTILKQSVPSASYAELKWVMAYMRTGVAKSSV